LNPAKVIPERKITSVRVRLSSLTITSVELSPSTRKTPMRMLANVSPSNQTATNEAREGHDSASPLRFEGPSSMPTALSGWQALLESSRYVAE